MHSKILVLGSACVDVILYLDHLPVTEEDMRLAAQRQAMGGCAWNVASFLGRAGADVCLVAPVGLQGLYGPWVLSHMKELSWAYPAVLEDQENGCCYCLVEKNGERTFLSLHGAEYTFDEAWVRDRSADWTYVCGLEIEEKNGGDMVKWLEKGHAGQIFYAPGPRGMRVREDLTQRLMALHPVLHLNRAEALALSGKQDTEEAMRALSAMTGSAVIVTLGQEGAAALENGRLLRAPAFPAEKVVDTIGAGDAHAGAMLLGLSSGMGMQASLDLAGCVSAAVVGVQGAAVPDDVIRKIADKIRL